LIHGALNIAIANPSIDRDVRANSSRIRETIVAAKNAGARLVLFPEAALSGYVKSEIVNWNDVDWSSLQAELDDICAVAKQEKVFVVVGSNHIDGKLAHPFNSLHVISDAGEIIARYDKRYCSHTEISNWYSSGNAPCLFEVDGLKFGCALCIEIQFAEVFSEYESLDADCVLFGAYSDDPMYWVQAQGHAAGNNMWIAVSTPKQCSSKLPGGLIGPNGSPISRVDANVEADFSLACVDGAAAEFEVALKYARPWRRAARSGAIYGNGRNSGK
jgi:deaminated glutathione amidase